MKNTCGNPLKLTWHSSEWQYKVNKPLDQSGLYVDKEIADALLFELIALRNRIEQDDSDFNIPSLNLAIENAQK